MPLAPASFLRAVCPPVVRMDGRRLGPLTLGHAVLLRAVGSPYAPFAAGGVLPSRGDVALARFVLTRPWVIARDTMDSARSARAIRWWGFFRARDWMVEALADWVRDSVAAPDFRSRHKSDSTLSSPLELILASHLIARGYRLAEALDVPVAQAWWLWLAAAEQDGRIELGDPDAPVPEPGVLYSPDVLQSWGAAQAARTKAGRTYDPAVDDIAVFAAARAKTTEGLKGCAAFRARDAFDATAQNVERPTLNVERSTTQQEADRG